MGLQVTISPDHGQLTGLGDDDHSIYIKADGTRAFTSTVDCGQNAVLETELAADPVTPAATKWKLYFKSGGLYQIDDAGAVVGPLGTGGGGNDATITSTDHYGGASSSDGIALATWLQYRDLKCEINGTAARVNASASFPQRVAVAGKLRAVADATTATTTLSGTAGARYIMADVSATATTFTLTNDTDNTPTATEKLVGVAYWDGAAITHTFTVGQHGNYEIIVTSTQITTTLGTYQDAGTVLTFVSDGITPSRLESQLLVSANYTSGTADNCFWALNVDSTVRQEVACVVYSAPAAERQSFNLAWEAGILSAGVHTAKIQQKASHTGLTAAVDGHVLPGKLWVVQVA